MSPDRCGSVARVVEFPPESEEFAEQAGAEMMARAFAQLASAEAHTGHTGASRHPMMHTTETVDVAVVLEGEMTMVLDTEDVHLERGSVVVQLGTNHGWSNRSGRVCRMLFVLMDGKYS